MSVTFAQSLSARTARWVAIVTIEGWGTSADKLYKICSEVPAYAAGDATYRPWLLDWPKLSSEQVDVSGGMPEASELEVQILDVGDALTSEWRTDADPLTYLNGSLTASTSSVTLDSASGVGDGTLLFVGNEVLIVSGAPVGSTVTVARGALDTDATAHLDGDAVFARLPYLARRRARLYLVPKDGALVDETLVGSFRLDQIELTEDLGGWVLRGQSQLRWLSRLAGRRPPFRVRVTGARPDSASFDQLAWDHRWTTPSLSLPRAAWPSPLGRTLVLNEETKEILSVSEPGSLQLWRRGLYGTQAQPIEAGHVLRQVFGADPLDDPDYPTTFFRRAAAGSPPSTRTSAWIPSPHWIDLILNLAVSSADPGDGLELANRNTTYGAWDCLPVGLGIGIPHDQIDWAAALAVRARTPEYLFPAFVLTESASFADIITEAFLRPIGAYLSSAGGLARIILPRIPIAGSSGVVLGPAQILRRKVAERVYQSTLTAGQDLSGLVSTVRYVMSGGNKLEFRNQDFGGTFGQAGYYATEDKPLEIPASAVRADSDGSSRALEECASRRMLRAMRPPWVIRVERDWGGLQVGIGDAVDFTDAQLPDQSTGVRGWTSSPVELAASRPVIDPERGLCLEWTLRGSGASARAGRVAPAACVVSVAGFVVTVLANRYTMADAGDGLPTSDTAAFVVGDVVQLCARTGLDVASGATETVSAIGANTLTLSGDFGGVLTTGAGNAGQVLRYAPSASATATQLDGYVYEADRAGRTIGATTRAPWRYGQP